MRQNCGIGRTADLISSLRGCKAAKYTIKIFAALDDSAPAPRVSGVWRSNVFFADLNHTMTGNSINQDRVAVNLNGNWESFLQIPQPYQEPKGTVRIGTDREGALLFDKQLDEYVMVDGYGRTLRLNQRKVRAALGEPEPVGKPRKGHERRSVYSVSLEPSLAQYLREFGDDSLSEGIRKVGEAHRSRSIAARGVSPITFPVRDPVYTASRTVLFLALQGDQLHECEISGEALRDHFGASSMKIHDLLTSFLANKDVIHRVARQKLPNATGRCLLLSADFATRENQS
jgi:hypothetical protein